VVSCPAPLAALSASQEGGRSLAVAGKGEGGRKKRKEETQREPRRCGSPRLKGVRILPIRARRSTAQGERRKGKKKRGGEGKGEARRRTPGWTPLRMCFLRRRFLSGSRSLSAGAAGEEKGREREGKRGGGGKERGESMIKEMTKRHFESASRPGLSVRVSDRRERRRPPRPTPCLEGLLSPSPVPFGGNEKERRKKEKEGKEGKRRGLRLLFSPGSKKDCCSFFSIYSVTEREGKKGGKGKGRGKREIGAAHQDRLSTFYFSLWEELSHWHRHVRDQVEEGRG